MWHTTICIETRLVNVILLRIFESLYEIIEAIFTPNFAGHHPYDCICAIC
jgi:hypothetical protein